MSRFKQYRTSLHIVAHLVYNCLYNDVKGQGYLVLRIFRYLCLFKVNTPGL